MGKKKELTVEERLIEERKNCLQNIKDRIKHLNEPTYNFEIANIVKYGAFDISIVKEILFDGKAYGLLCTSADNNSENQHYRIGLWTDVRPLTNVDTDFSRNQDVKINFLNSDIESLIHKYYYFGIDMNPEYQRGYVWTLEDKQQY